jgi:hypothetical protein
VYKKKDLDPMLPTNYRGIAVGGALAKCYATVLRQRLAVADKQLGLRHRAQAGFRQGYGTSDHLLVKRHLISLAKRRGGKPLIVVQVDFEKAFDRVPRGELWKVLEMRGVSGSFLQALQTLYQQVRMVVKVDGDSAAPFDSLQGVKQGCPLSPDLFGLFIETLAAYIDEADRGDSAETTHVADSPSLGALLVSLLLFADDTSLVATSPERMAFLLGKLDSWCDAFGMRVNIEKCEMMVFAPTDAAAAPIAEACKGLRLAGAPIPQVSKARYLGLVYGPGRPFVQCREQLLASGRGAMCALAAKLDRAKIWAPDIRLRCFEVQVRSVLAYGVEVWGPDALLEASEGGPRPRRRDAHNLAEGLWEYCLRDPAVRLQLTFLRHTAGAARPCHRLLFAELGQAPMQAHWLSIVVNFWNRIVARPGSLVHATLVEELRMAIESEGWGGWADQLLRFLRSLSIDVWEGVPEDAADPQARSAWRASRKLDVGKIEKAMRQKLFAGWAHPRVAVLPADFPEGTRQQPGIKMSRYKHWMGLEDSGSTPPSMPAHAKAFIPVRLHQLLMRFRMGCWPLSVNENTGVPRGQRVCQCCGMGAIEDERHVLLECPKYAVARAPLSCGPNDDMRTVMRDRPPRTLAEALRRIWVVRFHGTRHQRSDLEEP